MEINKTSRNFDFGKFEDLNHNQCSIQASSLASEDAIWLGIDDPNLVVFENESKGAYIKTVMPNNFMVNARMHLNRDQVALILPLLISFAENGTLHSDLSNKEDQLDYMISRLNVIHLELMRLDGIDPNVFNDLSDKFTDIKEALANMNPISPSDAIS